MDNGIFFPWAPCRLAIGACLRALGGISQKSKENGIHAAKGYRKYHFHEHSWEHSNSRKCSNSIFKILN